ncbi:hypothetical protein PG997_011960 [Apiospora hydei]|uniref:Uncharacterized protein n=1 Tax=Apiospora hydei TaxID=1337664 RepID=A0ABR1V213_9PEZI
MVSPRWLSILSLFGLRGDISIDPSFPPRDLPLWPIPLLFRKEGLVSAISGEKTKAAQQRLLTCPDRKVIPEQRYSILTLRMNEVIVWGNNGLLTASGFIYLRRDYRYLREYERAFVPAYLSVCNRVLTREASGKEQVAWLPSVRPLLPRDCSSCADVDDIHGVRTRVEYIEYWVAEEAKNECETGLPKMAGSSARHSSSRFYLGREADYYGSPVGALVHTAHAETTCEALEN